MPKKPDRFERDVLRALKKQGVPLDPDGVTISLIGPDVVKLLRKEHRAVMRMIRTRKQAWGKPLKWVLRDDTEALRKARANECQDILSKLNERAR